MPISAEYVARETVSNLWRNRLTTIAAIVTVAISLSLVGATMLLRQGAAQAEGFWQKGTQVTIWMEPSAAQQEINAIGAELKTLTYVEQPAHFHSQAYDFAQAKSLLPNVYVLGAGKTQTPSQWQVTPAQLTDATAIVKKFTGSPGVLEVIAPQAGIRREKAVINWLTWIFISVALLLLISAVVLILNTIRMAIFARRREVSVMKLVGATNWFVRLPFMSEGLIQGLIGSLGAAALVYFLHVILNDVGNTPGSLLNQMRMTGWQVVGTDVVVLLVGALVGTIGSWVAIRRFLDV